MKKASDVFKKIRFAKLDPNHVKAGPFSTDDEEHYTVSTKEWEQQVQHVKKRAMQEGAVESKEKTVTVRHETSGKEIVVTAQKAKEYQQQGYHQVKEAKEVGDEQIGQETPDGLVKKGNKTVMVKPLNQEAKDEGEYDQEGDMAKTQLRSIIYHAQELHDQLTTNDNLPEWVQSKITLSQDYMQTACDYMYSQKNVKEEVVTEAKKPKSSSLDKFRKASDERDKKHSQMPTGDLKGAVDRLEKHLNKEEVQKADVPAYLRKQRGDKPLTVSDVKAPRKDSISAAATLQKMKNEDADPCWKGYKMVGMKNKNGRKVPNCVPGEGVPAMKKEETTPPFDKPYTTTKAVVTDKSGAKHGPMSRARSIARDAMKKQAEKMPVKKSIKESRKSEIVKDIVKKKMDPKDKFQANPTLTSQVQKIDNAVT
jgi:hypothetical protein